MGLLGKKIKSFFSHPDDRAWERSDIHRGVRLASTHASFSFSLAQTTGLLNFRWFDLHMHFVIEIEQHSLMTSECKLLPSNLGVFSLFLFSGTSAKPPPPSPLSPPQRMFALQAWYVRLKELPFLPNQVRIHSHPSILGSRSSSSVFPGISIGTFRLLEVKCRSCRWTDIFPSFPLAWDFFGQYVCEERVFCLV